MFPNVLWFYPFTCKQALTTPHAKNDVFFSLRFVYICRKGYVLWTSDNMFWSENARFVQSNIFFLAGNRDGCRTGTGFDFMGMTWQPSSTDMVQDPAYRMNDLETSLEPRKPQSSFATRHRSCWSYSELFKSAWHWEWNQRCRARWGYAGCGCLLGPECSWTLAGGAFRIPTSPWWLWRWWWWQVLKRPHEIFGTDFFGDCLLQTHSQIGDGETEHLRMSIMQKSFTSAMCEKLQLRQCPAEIVQYSILNTCSKQSPLWNPWSLIILVDMAIFMLLKSGRLKRLLPLWPFNLLEQNLSIKAHPLKYQRENRLATAKPCPKLRIVSKSSSWSALVVVFLPSKYRPGPVNLLE